jgi:tetratricopeptide (TPR) repeat protein
MKRSAGILWLSVIFSLSIPNAFAAEVLTNDAVVTMVKAGLGEEIVLSKIKASQSQFDLSVEGLLRLKEAGVSETVIKAMVETAVPRPAAVSKTADEVAKETQDAVALYQQGKLVDAEAAFDKLIRERPGDESLQVWKASALLEQARALKDANASGFKPLVVRAYSILQPLGKRIPNDADWNFAMAKAFWLNDRPTWAGRAAKKALESRAGFGEPQLLLGDLAYDSDAETLSLPAGNPHRQIAMQFLGATPRKEYEKELAIRDLSAALQAEALYTLGLVAADLEKKPDLARDHWTRAVAADPTCRYGVMAQKRLQAAPGK